MYEAAVVTLWKIRWVEDPGLVPDLACVEVGARADV